jgi:hypothetical protein
MVDVGNDAATRMRNVMDADTGDGGELWNPEVGEFLVAEFLRYESRYSKKMNSDVKVAVARELDTNKLWSIWLSREVLRSEFERKAPRDGDLIGVKYHGRKVNSDGSEGYHRYSLEVDRLGRGPAQVATAIQSDEQNDPDDLDELPF